jgi:NADH:ubiquinone oxidoreductase subunit 5 (subunit L)/multisubunit Na+/H+ antiporter MnhA subunit
VPHLSTWLMSPLLPATVLVGGAALVWLARRFLPSHWSAKPMIHGTLPAVSILTAIVAIWWLRQPVSPSRPLLTFPPTLGVDLSLRVQLDEWGRLFGLSLLWPALTLAGLDLIASFSNGRDTADSPAWPRWLVSLAAAQVVLAAADWLTLAAALVLFDLVYLAFAAPQHGRGWSFMANGLSGLAFLAAAFVLSLGDHSLALAESEPLSARATLLITLAAVVRLAPYPFHFWLPDPQEMPLPAWRWLVRLLPAAIGLYLVTRITPLLDRTGPTAHLALIAGIVGCLAAALLAWLNAGHEPKQAIAFIGLYQTSLVLLSWAVLGKSLTGFWTALNLILGTTALTMHGVWSNSRNGEPLIWWGAVPGGVAAAALAGLPLTVGLFVRLPLCRALLANRQAGWLALLLLAESALAATLLRVWSGLNPDRFTRQSEGERPPWSLWGATALLVVPLLILGSCPSLVVWLAGSPSSESFPPLPTLGQLAQAGIGTWAAFLLPLVMGYGVYRGKLTWPDEMADVEAQLDSALRLSWLHRVAAQLLDRARQALWSVGAVLHGEGYLAWMTFSLLLIFLLVLSR